MTAREDVLARLESLIDRLDREAFELAVETRGETRRVRARPTSARTDEDPDGPTGREKFATRRRVKRLDRLLKRAGREGIEPAALVEPAEPRLRTVPDGAATATVFVDRPAADAHPDDGGSTLVVETGEATVTADLPFEATAVDRQKRDGFTAFRVRGEAGGGDGTA